MEEQQLTNDCKQMSILSSSSSESESELESVSETAIDKSDACKISSQQVSRKECNITEKSTSSTTTSIHSHINRNNPQTVSEVDKSEHTSNNNNTDHIINNKNNSSEDDDDDNDNSSLSRESNRDYSEDTHSSNVNYEEEEDEDEEDEDEEDEEEGDVQENWLKFRSFDVNGLDDHHIMVVRGFRRVMAIGTNQGSVALVDIHTARCVRIYHNHTNPIADVSCDLPIRYIASCDKAGCVVIQSVRHGKSQERWEANDNKGIQSVALHPLYYKLDDAPLVFASADRVVLLTKSLLPLFSRRRETVLFSQMSKIVQVRWSSNPSLLAWVSEKGVFVYHYRDRCLLHRCQVEPQMASTRFYLYPCTLLWEDAHRVLCGWGNWIVEVELAHSTQDKKVEQEKQQQQQQQQQHYCNDDSVKSNSLCRASSQTRLTNSTVISSKHAHITVMKRTPLCLPSEAESPFRVCGIAPFDSTRYVCLAASLQLKHLQEEEQQYILRDEHNTNVTSNMEFQEGVIASLEVRVVERDTLEDCYRGRLDICPPHPLQLGLTLVTLTSIDTTRTTKTSNIHDKTNLTVPRATIVPTTQCSNGTINSSMTEHDNKNGQSPLSHYTNVNHNNNNNNICTKDDDNKLISPVTDIPEIQLLQESNNFNINKPVLTESDPSLSLFSDDMQTFSQLASDDLWGSNEDGGNDKWDEEFEQHHEHISECDREGSRSENTTNTTTAQITRNAMSRQATNKYMNSNSSNRNATLYNECVYIVSAADVIIHTTRCDNDDHVDYLIETNKIEEAYEFVRTHALLARHTHRSIAQCLISYYFHKGCYDKFIPRMPQLLNGDVSAWEYWIAQLDSKQEAWRVVTVLPTRDECKSNENHNTEKEEKGEIDTRYYDMVLRSCLYMEPVLLPSALRRYASHFSIMELTNAVGKVYLHSCTRNTCQEDHMLCRTESSESRELSMSLSIPHATELNSKCESQLHQHLSHMELQTLYGEVYSYLLQLQGRNEEALHVLLHIQSCSPLFKLIRSASLFNEALELLPELFTRSVGETLSLLLEHVTQDDKVSLSEVNSANECLAPERVIAQLQHIDRVHLLRYFQEIEIKFPVLYTTLARRHAQLIALLLIEFDTRHLLPFLRKMSMYLERIREVYVLCKKNDLIEEMVLLMSRMGRDEEALQLIITRLNDVRKALHFILDIPSLNEQRMLFRTLVSCTIAHHSSLPTITTPLHKETLSGGSSNHSNYMVSRYFMYTPHEDETYATIARKFGIDECVLQQCNQVNEQIIFSSEENNNSISANNNSNKGKDTDHNSIISKENSSITNKNIHGEIKVPIHLISQLLRAVSEPPFVNSPAIDTMMLLHALPEHEAIPNAASAIAQMTIARAEEAALLNAFVNVAEADLTLQYGKLLRQQTAGFAIIPQHLSCAFCGQLLHDKYVAFACQHCFHGSCVLSYLASENWLTLPPAKIDVDAFMHSPRSSVQPNVLASHSMHIPYCNICYRQQEHHRNY